jgi:hypothetical protein
MTASTPFENLSTIMTTRAVGLKLMGLRQFRYLALAVEARGAGCDILDRRPRPWRSSQVFALVIMVLLDKLSWQGWN